MPLNISTPGVFIEESAFPLSIVSVDTSVPVFIGYTQAAENHGKTLLKVPTSISCLAEYESYFGKGFEPKFNVTDPTPGVSGETITLNGQQKVLRVNDNNTFYLYNGIRMFFANGGARCYILSVATYGDKPNGLAVSASDYSGNQNVFTILKQEAEPSLIVLPDLMALGTDAYPVYQLALANCQEIQSRFVIIDVDQKNRNPASDIGDFRNAIGTASLKYGAAYYPWLNTSVIQNSDVSFTNLDAQTDLSSLLPEAKARVVVANMKSLTAEELIKQKGSLDQSLRVESPVYVELMNAITKQLSLMPPSSAIAGLYAFVDNSRGVWKAPANVQINGIVSPAIPISQVQQEGMNVDIISGKSVNAIRSFPGIGNLVWGARTLDGNSQDWRYISIRRTTIMIEQSIKLSLKSYVFQPNDSNTWVTVKSMISNFLHTLWAQGALQGSKPEEAYAVQLGLGSTMTPDDILNGVMIVNIELAVQRPAEFIVITLRQQMESGGQ